MESESRVLREEKAKACREHFETVIHFSEQELSGLHENGRRKINTE